MTQRLNDDGDAELGRHIAGHAQHLRETLLTLGALALIQDAARLAAADDRHLQTEARRLAQRHAGVFLQHGKIRRLAGEIALIKAEEKAIAGLSPDTQPLHLAAGGLHLLIRPLGQIGKADLRIVIAETLDRLQLAHVGADTNPETHYRIPLSLSTASNRPAI